MNNIDGRGERRRTPPGNGEGSAVNRVTLTAAEIRELAEIASHGEEDEEYTIEACGADGVVDDDGSTKFFRYVAYLTEYPEEGVFPLGEQIRAPQPASAAIDPRLEGQ